MQQLFDGLSQQIISVFYIEVLGLDHWGSLFCHNGMRCRKAWRSSHQNTNKFLTLVKVRGLCHMVRFSFLVTTVWAKLSIWRCGPLESGSPGTWQKMSDFLKEWPQMGSKKRSAVMCVNSVSTIHIILVPPSLAVSGHGSVISQVLVGFIYKTYTL